METIYDIHATPPFRRSLVTNNTSPLTTEECQEFARHLAKVWPHNPSIEQLEEFAVRALNTIAELEERLKQATHRGELG